MKCMTQDERWQEKYKEVKAFIETNKRNPSKHRIEEHLMLNFIKHNRKLMNKGEMSVGSVSSQQRSGVTDIKALGVSQLSGLGQTVL